MNERRINYTGITQWQAARMRTFGAVDCLDLADKLKKALITYTKSGGQGQGMTNEEFQMSN